MKSKKQSKQELSQVNKERSFAPILGVNVSGASRSLVLTEVLRLVEAGKSMGSQAQNKLKIIVTPNPEIVYRASTDPDYRRVLNSADLSLADGIGLIWARRFLGTNVPNFFTPLLLGFEALSVLFDTFENGRQKVVPGRLVFEDLVREAALRRWRVFLLGGQAGVAEKAAQKLSAKYSVASIQYASGPWLNLKGEPENKEQARVEAETIAKINKFKPDLLFVAFGPPKQELWLYKNKSKLNAKVAMVVGGAFDYTAGIVPMPPKFVNEFGLEWAWRLVTQPQRAGRIYTAVVKFPLKVFKEKLKQS